MQQVRMRNLRIQEDNSSEGQLQETLEEKLGEDEDIFSPKTEVKKKEKSNAINILYKMEDQEDPGFD